MAHNRVRDAAHQRSSHSAETPTAHHDQVRLELLGQGHDLQIHLPHPEVSPGHGAPGGLHPPGLFPQQLPGHLFYLLVEPAFVAERPWIALQKNGHHSDVHHVQLRVGRIGQVHGSKGGQFGFFGAVGSEQDFRREDAHSDTLLSRRHPIEGPVLIVSRHWFVYGSEGPDLSKLSGKTVVWATGRAFLSKSDEDCYSYYYSYYYGYYNSYYVTKTTLTSTDQATLKNFLDGGGKLVITGMDALFLIEGSPFVSSTLNLDVASCVGGETFSGASCTAFDGEAYTFNSPTAYAPYHAMVVPATSAAVIQGSYPEVPPTWKSKDGTSMAAPHATGAAALAASVEPALLDNPVGLKNRIMNGKPLVAAAGKTVSGDMVDALKAAHPPTDTTAPTVSSVVPTEGAKDVDTTSNVVASFSEAMEAASVTDPANFMLRNGGCNTPATLSYDSDNKKATLVPSAPLDTASTYTVTVSGPGTSPATSSTRTQTPRATSPSPRRSQPQVRPRPMSGLGDVTKTGL